MVQSLINPDILFPETDEIDPEDVGYSAMTCELAGEKEGHFTLVAFGKLKYTFHDRGILYYPLYLLTKGWQIKAKIGVVEVPVKHLIRILDENKQIRLDLLEDPLLFAFANSEYLEHFRIPDNEAAATPPKAADSEVVAAAAATATTDDDDDASESVRRARELLAHGVFRKNKKAAVATLPEETESENKALQHAFEEQNETDTVFWVQRFLKNGNYGLHTVVASADSLLRCICDAFEQLGRETTVAKLRALVALEATAKVFTSRREAFERAEKTKAGATLQAELTSGYAFQDVTSLQHFREFILTSRFRPDDAWALATLEKKLQMKLIILLEREFEGGDAHHVVHCFPTSSVRAPEHYVVLTRSGNTYGLVTYKNKTDTKSIFSFTELPWGLKQLVAQRCAEKSAAGFEGIAEFQDLASQRGYQDDNKKEEDEKASVVVFQFHRHAKSKAGPGQGPNERVPVNSMQDYQPLRLIPQWRQKLDDAWVHSKFALDGKTWTSVVHYVQSNKFRKSHPDYADTFALESKTALSKNVNLALAATQKKNDIAPEKVGNDVRQKALLAKFSQNADLMHLLHLTKPATLLHYVPNRVTRADEALMQLRDGKEKLSQ